MSAFLKYASISLLLASISSLYGCGSDEAAQGLERAELTPAEIAPAEMAPAEMVPAEMVPVAVGQLSVDAGSPIVAVEGTEVVLEAQVTVPSDSSLKRIEWTQSVTDEVRAELPADFAQRAIRFIAPQVNQTSILNFTVRAESSRGQVVSDELTVQVDNKSAPVQSANSKPMLKSAEFSPNPVRPSEEVTLTANPITPGVGLAAGSDSAGSCTPGGELSWPHFWGALHEHTAYSDGAANTKPSDVFSRVKSKGLDFAISTDHSDNMGLPVPVTVADEPQFCVTSPLSCVLSDPQDPVSNFMKWDATLDQAQKMSSSGFTAMRGYEWTSDRFGHANILFSRNYINPKTGPGYAITMDSLWAWFLAPANFGGGNDGLLVFNHPGREDALHGPLTEIKSAIPVNTLASPIASGLSELGLGGHAAHSVLTSEGDPAYAFNDFAYVPTADYRVVGIEVFGKGDEYDTDGKKGSWLAYALDKGWYLAPAGSEDHHDRSWGESNLPKTVLIARTRKPEDLREAMTARRMYAVAQNFNDLQLVLTAKDSKREYHMGSRIASPDSSLQFNFRMEVRPGKTAPYDLSKTVIEVISSQGQNSTKYTPVSTATGQQSSFKLPVKDRQSWMFVRVRDSISKKIVAVSAPFWFKPGSAPLPTCNPSR